MLKEYDLVEVGLKKNKNKKKVNQGFGNGVKHG